MGLPQANPVGLNPQAALLVQQSPSASVFTPANAAAEPAPVVPHFASFAVVPRTPVAPAQTGAAMDPRRRAGGRPACVLLCFGVGGSIAAYFPPTANLPPTAMSLEAGKMCVTDLAGFCGQLGGKGDAVKTEIAALR